MNTVLFAAIAAFVLISACMVVRVSNLFHAGLSLVATFFGVASIYAMLDAHFLAAVQVLIYVGAIAVILKFAVMLTQHLTEKEPPGARGRLWGAFALCLSFAVSSLYVIYAQPWSTTTAFRYVQVADIGRYFLDRNEFLLPFEMVALLLLVALVGAIMVASKEGEHNG
jgi:NADH:ubiquinone oxidoreductase subunit 6 (subunit J)